MVKSCPMLVEAAPRTLPNMGVKSEKIRTYSCLDKVVVVSLDSWFWMVLAWFDPV